MHDDDNDNEDNYNFDRHKFSKCPTMTTNSYNLAAHLMSTSLGVCASEQAPEARGGASGTYADCCC